MRREPARKSGAEASNGVGTSPDNHYDRIKDWLWRRIAWEVRFARHVLDIGCGSCELDRFVARENRQDVLGIDISDGSFPEDQGANSQLDCRRADARKLDFLKDDSIDAVVSLYSLHEMEKPIDVLKEAQRIVRLGGGMLIVDFPRGSLAQRIWNENYYALEEVAEMLRQGGFGHVESRLIAQGQLIWAQGCKVVTGRDVP